MWRKHRKRDAEGSPQLALSALQRFLPGARALSRSPSSSPAAETHVNAVANDMPRDGMNDYLEGSDHVPGNVNPGIVAQDVELNDVEVDGVFFFTSLNKLVLLQILIIFVEFGIHDK